jgi:hypothetical protein
LKRYAQNARENKSFHWRWMLAGVVTYIVGAVALYCGGMMTFLVPGYPRESIFQKERLLLGVLPVLEALEILSIADCLSDARSMVLPHPTGRRQLPCPLLPGTRHRNLC